MTDQFKDFPLCINCKYYLPEKTGPMQIIGTCGLTMINPVTGDFVDRANRIKLAAYYRGDSMPCGPAGLFFKPGKKKVEPKKKPVVKAEPKVSTAKVISVDVPEIDNKVELPGMDDLRRPVKDLSTVKEVEAPNKRRRRDK